MPNGSSHESDPAVWTAIDGLRGQVQRVSEKAAVTESQQTAILTAVTDSKNEINARFDRMRNVSLALLAIAVPVVSALVGALLQGGSA